MKNLFKLPVIALGLVLLLSGFTQKAVAQDDDISLQTFYDELSPYGTWIQDAEYGYVWRPDVDQREFRPYYSNGRWVMTEYGNTWVSDYDWGWAPFHYGRWMNNRYNEWVWVPDTVWGPAWVSWRSGGGYYGWAPLMPGFNININLGGGYHIPNNYWCFVPQSNIYYSSFPRYRSYRNVTIIRNTTIINYTGQRNRNAYYTGPRRDDIRRATKQDVRVYNVNRTNRAGETRIANNTVNIYNPRSSRNVDNKEAKPRTVTPGSAYTSSRANGSTGRGAATGSRANREGTAQNQRGTVTDRAGRTQRTEQVRPQGSQATPSTTPRAERSRSSQAPATAQTPRTERSNQVQAQQQAEQSQRAERSRESQVQAQQQAAAQRAESSRQQQAQAQAQRAERSRQEATQRTQQAQPQRQERVQQSTPSRSSESRGTTQSRGSERSARGGRG